MAKNIIYLPSLDPKFHKQKIIQGATDHETLVFFTNLSQEFDMEVKHYKGLLRQLRFYTESLLEDIDDPMLTEAFKHDFPQI